VSGYPYYLGNGQRILRGSKLERVIDVMDGKERRTWRKEVQSIGFDELIKG